MHDDFLHVSLFRVMKTYMSQHPPSVSNVGLGLSMAHIDWLFVMPTVIFAPILGQWELTPIGSWCFC